MFVKNHKKINKEKRLFNIKIWAVTDEVRPRKRGRVQTDDEEDGFRRTMKRTGSDGR